MRSLKYHWPRALPAERFSESGSGCTEYRWLLPLV
jgi:hypothetical protein